MEEQKMNESEAMALKSYVIQPSIKLFGGIKVTKEMQFLTQNDDGSVVQTLNNLKLTTTIRKKGTYRLKTGDVKQREKSKLVQELPEGQLLLWGEDTGYIIPEYVMCTPKEAIEQLKILANEGDK